MTIQCDHIIEATRPDIVVVEKESNKSIIMDVASPWDHRVYEKESAKIEKCQDLKIEIRKLWAMRRVEVVPVVVGALGAVINQKIEYMAWQAGDFHEYGFAAENSIVGSSKDLKEGIGKLKEEN